MLRLPSVVFLSLACCLAAAVSFAADDAPPPPEVTERIDPGESLEPEVTIVQQGENRIEEYRVNGKLYMIKVVPRKGFPYYLVDNDGDGELETRRNDLDPDIVVPRWTLFRF